MRQAGGGGGVIGPTVPWMTHLSLILSLHEELHRGRSDNGFILAEISPPPPAGALLRGCSGCPKCGFSSPIRPWVGWWVGKPPESLHIAAHVSLKRVWDQELVSQE